MSRRLHLSALFDMEEKKLSGGNMTVVTRVGNTVRREANPWTPQIHKLLAHLRAKGIAEVPAPLGFDEQGREILTFIPGEAGHGSLPIHLRSDELLIAAARLLRRLHDATEDVAQTWRSGWQVPAQEPIEVICHGDFAPYNCVYNDGKLIGVIDFDHAHPAPRSWDIAYAIYRFAPLTDPTNPEAYGSLAEQARRARLFCEAYGLSNREGIVPAIKARVVGMAAFLHDGAANGDARLQANIAEGHLAIYETDYRYIETNEAEFRRALEG